jgi:dihydropteroate synthase
VPISIDTMKASVANDCLAAGASIVNDVTGLSHPEMVRVVREFGAGAIVMHMQGTPRNMQENPHYHDVVAEVSAFFEARLQKLADEGIAYDGIAIDPGIGFGKRAEHNWQLVNGLDSLRRFGRPIVLGVSRKRFLGEDVPPSERVPAGLAIARQVRAVGSANVIRTHDVALTVQAMKQATSEKSTS